MSPSVRGHFLWHELLTTDPDGARRFYGGVVGWSTTPWGDSYSVWMTGQTPRGGMIAMPADLKAKGIPPHWGTYIGTDDVDATISQATGLGARVEMAPMDLPEVGRMALLQDPQGALFYLFKPTQEGTPSFPATPGGFAWNELATTNWPAAFDFYSALFGWKKGQAMDLGPAMGLYQMIEVGGHMVGAMYNKPPEIPVPNWLPYAEVASAAGAAAAVTAAGGTVIAGPMEVPGGAIVQFMDPQGAVFAVHASAVPVAAPPKPAARKAAPKPAAPKAASKPATTKAVKKPAKKAPAKPRRKAAKKPAKKAPAKPRRKVAKKSVKVGKKAATRSPKKTAAKTPARRVKRRR
ncbi:MAG: VOC family protein [Gemmatimonadetes bacterium]|nr:VOC family protein [Gemmatimonadota bacterium]